MNAIFKAILEKVYGSQNNKHCNTAHDQNMCDEILERNTYNNSDSMTKIDKGTSQHSSYAAANLQICSKGTTRHLTASSDDEMNNSRNECVNESVLRLSSLPMNKSCPLSEKDLTSLNKHALTTEIEERLILDIGENLPATHVGLDLTTEEDLGIDEDTHSLLCEISTSKVTENTTENHNLVDRVDDIDSSMKPSVSDSLNINENQESSFTMVQRTSNDSGDNMESNCIENPMKMSESEMLMTDGLTEIKQNTNENPFRPDSSSNMEYWSKGITLKENSGKIMEVNMFGD